MRGAHAAYDWSQCRVLSQHQLALLTTTRPSPQISALARVVVTRTVALAPTLLVALLANAPNQLDVLNQWLNILQSIQLPFAIIPVRRTRVKPILRLRSELTVAVSIAQQRGSTLRISGSWQRYATTPRPILITRVCAHC